jgi:molybdopterin/thiamine biosynthesis adenylyltransferase
MRPHEGTDRYSRQSLLSQIGTEGQARLLSSRVLLVGCGALGTVLADQLVRAGVGWIRIVDRDIVELGNLHRQTLFDESDAKNDTPKAIAAANRLRRTNSQVNIDAIVADVDADNIEKLIVAGDGQRVDLILDGTDNAETRYMLNDVAVKHAIRWVYGGCVGTEGRAMPIDPGTTACLRCIFRDAPAAGELPTCSTAGVLASASAMVASLQAIAAIKFLIGSNQNQQLISFDAWSGRWRSLSTVNARQADCPACGLKQFDFLNQAGGAPRVLCGRNAVQFQASKKQKLDLPLLADSLGGSGEVRKSIHLLRYQPNDDRQIDLSIFSDGRVIVHGVEDVARARTIYSRYLGA